ncbi:putative DYW domain-containing protein [Helianthus anomalus]
MKENKFVKYLGYSWIEVMNRVHEFRSGDRIHPELLLIHEKLNKIGDEDESGWEKLLWHSEKLAIAYGMIKMPRGVPIRVFNNLRVCRGCHEDTKFISAIEKGKSLWQIIRGFIILRKGMLL